MDSISLCSLESDNETISDNPGPGRLIDKYIYQRGGRALEAAISRLRQKQQSPAVTEQTDIELSTRHSNVAQGSTSYPSSSSQTNGAVVDGHNTEPLRPTSPYYECSLFSSSTLTVSDNIGPGRTLYKLYSLGGKALESAVSTIAHDAGYGPHATGKRIIDTYESLRAEWLRVFVLGGLTSERMIQLESKLFKLCNILAEYTFAESAQTRQQSLEWVIILATQYWRLRHHLKHPEIMKSFSRLPDLYLTRRYTDDDTQSFLKFLSDQAIICVSENEVIRVIDDIVLSFSADIMIVLQLATEGVEASDDVTVINFDYFFRLLDYCSHPTYSYVAIRFTSSVLALLSDNRLDRPLSRYKQLIWARIFDLVNSLLDARIPDSDTNSYSEVVINRLDPDGVDLLFEAVFYTLQKELDRIPPSERPASGFWFDLTMNISDRFKGNSRVELFFPRATAVARYDWDAKFQKGRDLHLPNTTGLPSCPAGHISPDESNTLGRLSPSSVPRTSEPYVPVEWSDPLPPLSFLNRQKRRMRKLYYLLTDKVGIGQHEVAEYIRDYFEYANVDIGDSKMFGTLLALGWSCECESVQKMKEAAAVVNLDKKIATLMGYLGKQDAQTLLLSLRDITSLCTMYPVLRRRFNTPYLQEQLCGLPKTALRLHFSPAECQELKEAAQRALVCISDNQVTKIVDDLASLILKQVVDLQHRHDYYWGGTQGLYYREENSLMNKLLQLCLDTELGYAAFRYTANVLLWLLSQQTNKVVWKSVYNVVKMVVTSEYSTQEEALAADVFTLEAIRYVYFVASCTEPGTKERIYWARQTMLFTSLFRSMTRESIFSGTLKMITLCNEAYPDVLDGVELDTPQETTVETEGEEASPRAEHSRDSRMIDNHDRSHANVATLGQVIDVALAPKLHVVYKAINVSIPEEVDNAQ